MPDSTTSRPFRGNQDAAGRIHLDVGGITQQDALPAASRHRPRGDLVALGFPDVARIHQQAAVRVFGKREASFALNHQGVTMLGRDGHPAFRI
jgi:hypothetical protein